MRTLAKTWKKIPGTRVCIETKYMEKAPINQSTILTRNLMKGNAMTRTCESASVGQLAGKLTVTPQ